MQSASSALCPPPSTPTHRQKGSTKTPEDLLQSLAAFPCAIQPPPSWEKEGCRAGRNRRDRRRRRRGGREKKKTPPSPKEAPAPAIPTESLGGKARGGARREKDSRSWKGAAAADLAHGKLIVATSTGPLPASLLPPSCWAAAAAASCISPPLLCAAAAAAAGAIYALGKLLSPGDGSPGCGSPPSLALSLFALTFRSMFAPPLGCRLTPWRLGSGNTHSGAIRTCVEPAGRGGGGAAFPGEGSGRGGGKGAIQHPLYYRECASRQLRGASGGFCSGGDLATFGERCIFFKKKKMQAHTL